MSVLPSPIPHPLDYCPFDVPQWAYEALEWVVGFDWPEGNEKTTWDVADRWYAIAGLLAEPRGEAHDAAAQVLSAYGGTGAQAFRGAWQQLAADEDAPLNSLLAIADELGKLVEECGCDIEGAKLEAWIEIGLFLIELIGMAVAVALTLGAASPAAGGLIAATRIAIQQIFKRLVEQMSKKAIKKTLKEAGERATRQLTSKAGLRQLGREGLREGLDEAREEFATSGGIQLYQNSTGRADGIDARDLGMSAAAGFGGGVAASGAGIGRGRHHGVTRGVGAEVLGEFGGAAVVGDLPDLESVAKSASSGAGGAVVGGASTGIADGLADRVGDLKVPASSTVPSALAGPGAGAVDAGAGAVPVSADGAVTAPGASVISSDPASGALPGASGGSAGGNHAGSGISPAGADGSGLPGSAPPQDSLAGLSSGSAGAPPTAGGPINSAPSVADPLSAEPSTAGPTTAGPMPPGPTIAGSAPAEPSTTGPTPPGPTIAASAPAEPSTTGPTPPGPTIAASAPAGPAVAGPSGSGLGGPGSSGVALSPWSPFGTDSNHTPPAVGGLGAGTVPVRAEPGGAAPPRSPHGWAPDGHGGPRYGAADVPSSESDPAVLLAGPPGGRGSAPEAAGVSPEVDGYLRHARELRQAHARARRTDALEYFEGKAESARQRARRARRSARVARFLKLNPTMAAYFRAGVDLAIADAERADAQVAALRDPNWVPSPGSSVEIAPHEWHRANEDRGQLALGGLAAGDRSMLTDSDHPPPIDRTRRYGSWAGLRPPLARHQAELEDAMPRDANGGPMRLADPRAPYFRLVNDGGPQADPTRGINCQDCVLSFFDTYLHGRPRVSAPRTFDAYSEGDPQRPMYGEEIGLERVEHATGGRLQSLCPTVAGEEPAVARQRIDRALADVSDQLLAGGHGSFAFLVNAWEGGSAHSWAAVNQNGEILFVDPQSGLVTESQPLYGHRGWPDPGNVVAVDALVVNGQGIPMPFPDRPDGAWRPQRTTLPPPPPRPTPIYYSAAYRAEPVSDPSPADRLAHAEPPEPHPPPEPNPLPEPVPRPEPIPPEPAPRPRRPIPSPRQPVDRIAEALEPRPAPVDRSAEPLAPRNPSRSDTALERAFGPRPPTEDGRAGRAERLRRAGHDAWERRSYRGYLDHARTTHEENRRADYADYLLRIADDRRARVLELGRQADAALAAGPTIQGEHLRTEARLTSEDAAALETRAESVLAGDLAPVRIEVEPADWIRINDDVGTMAVGAVETGDRSALTGTDIPPPIEHRRPYDRRGGLRAPLAVHQRDLENAMPREADGTVSRLADPRIGQWFALANDGGPQADPTRGINCVDGVLSLFDTYLHGRPRVSAPRTFDSYAQGDPSRPLGAEEGGLARIEDTVGGEFQGLCPYVGGLSHRQAEQAVDTAMTNLHNHLYNTGHGAFAFIVTDSEGGTAHAWAAVNQGGTILFLDPQTGRLSQDTPLYTHTGRRNDGNVVSMDAVVVNGRGEPAPLPYHRPGLWSRSPLAPTGAGPAIIPEDRLAIEAAVRAVEPVAERLSAQLHRVVTELNAGGGHGAMEVVHEEHRVKTADSLARTFAVESEFEVLDVSEFLQGVKDRVRFSVRLSEEGYVDAVESVLGRLGELGLQTDRIVNFWGAGGRHNGLNVTLRDATGFPFELQFPTALSLSISDDTHALYETLRLKQEPARLRVDAFLRMLAMNRERDVAAHQPEGLDRLPIDKTVDTTLARFIADEPAAWGTYARDLDRRGMSVEEALSRYGLAYDEVLPGTRSDDGDGRRGIRLSGGTEVRRVGRGDQPDRLPGSAGRPVPGGDLERTPEGLDLRPGAGGPDAVRRQVPGPDAGDRSGDGGTDRPGDAGHGTAEQRDSADDVRGGRTDGLAVRPTPDRLTAALSADVFGTSRSELDDDRHGVYLSDDPEVGRVGLDNEH
ncbi:toxin glutamine deamidase domain-containing protein, partial [Actinoplanes sp. NPDC005259]